MIKFTPSLEELIDRYAYQIKARNNKTEVSKQGKKMLFDAWIGKEKRLYLTVKDMENKQVQFENLQKRIDHRIMQTQIGVDVLGFPIYLVHEVVFETADEYKRRIGNRVSKQKFTNSKAYLVKQH